MTSSCVKRCRCGRQFHYCWRNGEYAWEELPTEQRIKGRTCPYCRSDLWEVR